MSIFKKFLGGRKDVPPATASAPVMQPSGVRTDPAKDPDMIKVYDAYGRELFITRDNWRESVLKGAIEKAWNDADQLAGLVTQLLYDSFFAEAVPPVDRRRPVALAGRGA
jgi:hypothetical protein